MGMFDGITSPVASLIGAGTSLLGGIMTNNAQKDIAQEANRFSAEQSDVSRQFNAEQAQKQMDFQKEMRSTQYQTAVQDLKAAGLNPMLAYTQGGSGNLTGSSATSSGAVGQQAQLQNPTSGFANSAAVMANIRADLDQKEAQTIESISRTGVNDEQRKLTSAQTALAILEAPNVSLKNKQIAQQILLDSAKTSATSAMEAATRLDTMIRQPEAGKSKTWWGTNVSPYLKDFTQGSHTAVNAASLLK